MQNAAAADPTILLDWSTPFDQFKVKVLENVVNVMYSGSSQNVRDHQSIYNTNRESLPMTS